MEAGDAEILTKYDGAKMYNFGCDFVVPRKDEELEELIREWNLHYHLPVLEKIQKKIDLQGGEHFVWY